MKTIIAFTLVCSFAVKTFSQNVGIGTTVPVEKLEVAGNVKTDTLKTSSLKLTGNAGVGKVLTSDAFGVGSWQAPAFAINAANGLIKSGDSIKLGGIMLEHSNIRLNAHALFITDTGSAISLTVNQPNFPLVLPLGSTAITQTFKAANNGALTSIEIYIDAFGGSNITMQVKDVSGLPIGSATNNYPATLSTWSLFSFNNLLLTSGKIYTLSITCTGTTQIHYDNGNPYSEGSSSIGASADIAFKVFSAEEKNLLFLNGNRIGINTLSPGATLDIAGTVKINDGTQGAGKLLASDAGGTAAWQTVNINTLGGWGINGNTGTSPSNFIGTVDSIPFIIKVNNQNAGRIDPDWGAGTFFGYRAGNSTTEINNTAIGREALYSNTTGGLNTATGAYSLYSSTTGYANTATGYNALRNNTTGSHNAAHGVTSLYSNTTGNENTASGYLALRENTTGSFNTAGGSQALSLNTTGQYNTAFGAYSLLFTTSSQYNVATGFAAGDTYDNGYNNVFVGANADVNQAGLFNVIAMGHGTVVTSGSSTARFGNSSTVSYGGWAGWTTISDGRFKKNVTENVPGIDFIKKLRPVSYTLDATGLDAFYHKDNKEEMSTEGRAFHEKALKEKEKITYTGFVAQEVEAAAKELGFNFSGVDPAKNDNDTYGLRYAEFVVPLVKAMQEQQKLIVELKKQNEELLKRIERLEPLLSSKK